MMNLNHQNFTINFANKKLKIQPSNEDDGYQKVMLQSVEHSILKSEKSHVSESHEYLRSSSQSSLLN